MRILLLILCTAMLISCSTQAPNEDEVKEMVKYWYMQQSTGDGAGTWTDKGITVLSIREDERQKDIFNTVSLVSGIHKSPAIAEPKPDTEFNDTLKMNLRWNGGRWVTED